MKTLKIRFWALLSVSFVSLFCVAEKQLIVFIKPVANLISQEPKIYQNFEKYLNNYSPEVGQACPRTFQALFGEMGFVEDPEPRDGYVRVELYNCFFATKSAGIKPLYYCADRADFVFWEKLTASEQALFPPPIFYQKPESVDTPGVVTLTQPWACRQNGLVYSAGTRFIAIDFGAEQKTVTVQLFDASRGLRVIEAIPAKLLVNRGQPVPVASKRAVFVKLLKKWCKRQIGVIPYVWGGASYVSRTMNENFRLIEDSVNGKRVSYWVREESKIAPDGFDCSGLVLRAAQACGIGYFCRTAGTAGNLLTPLSPNLSIEPGDLFVTEGHNHIFVAAGNNTIFEAAGYSSGYACVHRIPVALRFLNAQNYQDLIALFRAHQVPIYRCRDGQAVTPSGFAIVKLPV